MKKFSVDTNLYIRAFRNASDAAELEAFYFTFAPLVYLSSVVLHEVLVGGRTSAKRREIEDWLARPFRKTRRMFAPSTKAWGAAGATLAKLAAHERIDLRSIPKSFAFDVLLAESCRESGVVLITENGADFQRIRRFVRFEFEAPWPS